MIKMTRVYGDMYVPRGGKKGICRILRPSEVRNGRARACKRFREQNEQTTGKETV